MTHESPKTALAWTLALGGGLAAGASMMLFEQGMAKVLLPAALIVIAAFASTFLTSVRKRTAALAWLAGGLLAGVAASVGRYLELSGAAEAMAGAGASAEEVAVLTDAALADAKLGLTAVVFGVLAFVLAIVPLVLGAVARRKPAATPLGARP